MDSEPTVIYTARSAEDAHLLKNILAENGIDAQVVNAATPRGAGMVDSLAWRQVTVAEKDVVEARRIAAEFDQHTGHRHCGNSRAGDTAPSRSAIGPSAPVAARRRTAICPACRTEGSDFPPADRMPEAEPGEHRAAAVALPGVRRALHARLPAAAVRSAITNSTTARTQTDVEAGPCASIFRPGCGWWP